MRSTPRIEQNGRSFRVTVPSYILDFESQKIREDLLKKYEKSKSWQVRYTLPLRTATTLEEAMDWFVAKTREGGLDFKLTYNHKDKVVGKVHLNDDGSYRIEPIDEPVLIEEPKEQKIIEVISDPLSTAARMLIGQLVQISRCAVFDEWHVITLENIDPYNCRPFSGKDERGVVIEGGYIREFVSKVSPLDLSDPEMRDMLRGKWLRHKHTGCEWMVVMFNVDEQGKWYANRKLDADILMKDWELLDGTFLGVES